MDQVSVSSAVPLLHDDACWPEQLSVEHVAPLVDFPHHVVVFGRKRGLGANRLVDFRVERVIERIDDLQTVARERLQHFALDHVHTLNDSRRVYARWIDMGEPGEVVERVDETAHHFTLSAPPGLLAFLRGPLPEVVILSRQTQMLVALLVDLTLPLVASRQL